MSARYDAMVKAWERDNGQPAPLSVRLAFKKRIFGEAKGCGKTGMADAELLKLIKAQKKYRRK